MPRGRTARRVARSAASVEKTRGSSVLPRARPCDPRQTRHVTPRLRPPDRDCPVRAPPRPAAAPWRAREVRCVGNRAPGCPAPAPDSGRASRRKPRGAVAEHPGRRAELAASLQRLADNGDAHLRSIRTKVTAVVVGVGVVLPGPNAARAPSAGRRRCWRSASGDSRRAPCAWGGRISRSRAWAFRTPWRGFVCAGALASSA